MLEDSNDIGRRMNKKQKELLMIGWQHIPP